MKILKIFGIVVGIHVFALILIFANPGCSSTMRPTPAPTDTVSRSESPPPITLPGTASSPYAGADVSSAAGGPITFNPDAPAMAAPPSSSSTSGGRFMPTRPGTPVAGTLVAEPVVDVTPATTYAVKAGDSLWSIAKKYHLTVAELSSANGVKANTALRPGQKLLIPGKPASPAAAATATGGAGPTSKAADATPPAASAVTRSSGEGVKHVVKSGETLSMIAQQYGVRTKDIGAANNISDPAKIKAGTELIIPGWMAPAAKSGKAGSKSGPKSGESKSSLNVEPLPPASSKSAPPPAVPIIPIDENPITPAPKP